MSEPRPSGAAGKYEDTEDMSWLAHITDGTGRPRRRRRRLDTAAVAIDVFGVLVVTAGSVACLLTDGPGVVLWLMGITLGSYTAILASHWRRA
ncbi:MAG: hypothetical protein ABWY93_18780 [Mycobacterium sp.]